MKIQILFNAIVPSAIQSALLHCQPQTIQSVLQREDRVVQLWFAELWFGTIIPNHLIPLPFD